MNICPKIELVEILTRPDQGTVGGGDTDQYGTPSLGYREAGSGRRHSYGFVNQLGVVAVPRLHGLPNQLRVVVVRRDSLGDNVMSSEGAAASWRGTAASGASEGVVASERVLRTQHEDGGERLTQVFVRNFRRMFLQKDRALVISIVASHAAERYRLSANLIPNYNFLYHGFPFYNLVY
jgi:hypothetical protein